MTASANDQPRQPVSSAPPIRDLGPLKPRGTGGGIAIGGILVGILVLFLLGAVPVLLLLPAVNASREAARRGGCSGHMRQLGLAVANFESVQKQFPTGSDGSADLLKAQTVGGHGDAPAASDDGFSWLYQVLPYIEEQILYKEMRQAIDEDDAQTGPFDVDFAMYAGQPFAATYIGNLRCPSSTGAATTRVGDVEVATGNYCAIVGTDLAEGANAPWKQTPNWENGGLPSACWNTPQSQTTALAHGTCVGQGIGLRDMRDGISKTMIIAESREEVHSAWISGASMWVVAASPNSLAADGVAVGRSQNDQFIAMLRAGAVVPKTDVQANGLALNFGSDAKGPPAAECYLQAGDWATNVDRTWGPSSEHAGNTVIHAFADAHVWVMSADVDPTVYLQLVTRADGDPAREDELE